MRRITYILIITAFVAVACGPKKTYTVTQIRGEYVPVIITNNPDPEMQRFVNSYKVQLDEQMNVVIGYSAHHMSTGRPESLLTNLTSDWMMKMDTTHTQQHKIDLAFMNVHGIRATIAKGNITVGDIYNAYPFDNALTILQLKGKYLTQAFQSYAQMGGAGISGNVKLTIHNKELQSALIDGKTVDDNKIYTIVTLDYLAEGNDGMQAFKKADWKADTGIKLRDYMLDKVKKTTAKGEPISPKLDGRITIKE